MKVESFIVQGWEEAEMGLVLDENEDWVLVKHIPADYVIDGYKLYKKKFIVKRTVSEAEKKVARVLQLKKVETSIPPGFRFRATAAMLKWIEEHYEIFEFQDEEGSELYYGRINKIQDGMLVLNMIDADGHVETDEDIDHVIELISVIGFGSDYLYSLGLLTRDHATKNGSS
ncbi:MAG: hypothetical protein M3R08_08220 [Bacteroidota bacterium]|nr:hypothetical protein [Bacteroidota bacterium]